MSPANLEAGRDFPPRADEDLDFVFPFGPAALGKTIGVTVASGSPVPGLGFEADRLAGEVPEGGPTHAVLHVVVAERPVQPPDRILKRFGRVDRNVEARQ